MKLIYKFAEMTPEKRPQDPHLDGTGLLFETMEHGGNILTRCRKLSSSSMPKAAHAFTRRSRRTGRSSTAKDMCSI